MCVVHDHMSFTTHMHYSYKEGINTFFLPVHILVKGMTKLLHQSMYIYHFTWVDQREKQGYKSDVSLKRGIL